MDVLHIPPVGLLRCDRCGEVLTCTDGDLHRYEQTGWPRCCTEVMTYFISQGKPQQPLETEATERMTETEGEE